MHFRLHVQNKTVNKSLQISHQWFWIFVLWTSDMLHYAIDPFPRGEMESIWEMERGMRRAFSWIFWLLEAEMWFLRMWFRAFFFSNFLRSFMVWEISKWTSNCSKTSPLAVRSQARSVKICSPYFRLIFYIIIIFILYFFYSITPVST